MVTTPSVNPIAIKQRSYRIYARQQFASYCLKHYPCTEVLDGTTQKRPRCTNGCSNGSKKGVADVCVVAFFARDSYNFKFHENMIWDKSDKL